MSGFFNWLPLSRSYLVVTVNSHIFIIFFINSRILESMKCSNTTRLLHPLLTCPIEYSFLSFFSFWIKLPVKFRISIPWFSRLELKWLELVTRMFYRNMMKLNLSSLNVKFKFFELVGLLIGIIREG